MCYNNLWYVQTLVIFLYKLGEMFQDYALNNSHKSIKNLLELQPSVCHLVDGEKVEDYYTLTGVEYAQKDGFGNLKVILHLILLVLMVSLCLRI